MAGTCCRVICSSSSFNLSWHRPPCICHHNPRLLPGHIRPLPSAPHEKQTFLRTRPRIGASKLTDGNNFSLEKRLNSFVPHAHRKADPHQEDDAKQPSFHVDLEKVLAVATSLYPLYMVVGGIVAFLKPSSFTWFVASGPASYSVALGSIMLATGLSLRLEDLLDVILTRPIAVLFGFSAQYMIMPICGALVSRMLNLPAALSVGLILVSCCPGGTASNVVTYIARGDVPLSVVMTIFTTFGAVFATPLLTRLFAGAYVPVNAAGLALSTLQVVLVPVVLGAWLQSSFPKAVALVVPYTPLVAVLISSLLASSVFSANVGLLSSLVEQSSSTAGFPSTVNSVALLSPGAAIGPSFSGWSQMGLVAQAVLMVHAGGFFVGYLAAALAGYGEYERRAISIEVGMQNSSLGVVLATMHFSSPLVILPSAVSAVLMNVMGSGLAVIWRQFPFAMDIHSPSSPKDLLEAGTGSRPKKHNS